tara:strand:- start:89 stop:1495 length:1407 start_codon:yes stop_codon:yes gene_type:complete
MNTQVGDGLFVLRGKIVQYLDELERLTYRMGEMFDSERIWTPSHLSVDNTKKTGYTDSFSNQASLIHSVDGHELGMCSPTVCYHCYSMLSDTHHTEDKSYMMTGKCTRIEDEGDSLERLFNFTISEIVFVGDKDYCEESLCDAIFYTKQMLDQLGIKYYLECASDPFFGDKSELKEKVQLMGGSKIEIRAEVPNENRTIAIGSFNLHGKKFVKNFSIYDASTTACFGWGLERFVNLVKLQKGDDFNFNDIKFKKPDKFKKEFRLNLINNEEGWIRSGVDTYWFAEKSIKEYEIIEPDLGGVVYEDIDTIEKLEGRREEINRGMAEWDDVYKKHITEDSRKTWMWNYDTAKKRIEDGHNLCAMFYDDKLIQFNWWFFDEFTFYDHDWNINIKLPPTYSYGGYWGCLPKYRSNKKFPKLIKDFYDYITNCLIRRGIETDFAYIDGWNRNSIKIHRKMGYRGCEWLDKYSV